MLPPGFISHKSTFFEKMLEHYFIFDIERELVKQSPPRLLNVLKSEVDAFGFDLVLSLGDRTIHAQMKTCSGPPGNKTDNISPALWKLPLACVIWMHYNPRTLEPPFSYYLLDISLSDFPPPAPDFPPSKKRIGFHKVRMTQATDPKLDIAKLTALLFP